MDNRNSNTAGGGQESTGSNPGDFIEEKDDGNAEVSGEESDDESPQGEERARPGDESGDAGGEEDGGADDDEEEVEAKGTTEVEADAPPPPRPAKRAGRESNAAASKAESSDADADPDADADADADPELAKLTSEMKEVEKRGRETIARAEQIRRFMKGQIKLTDGTAYADLDEADRTLWRAELEDAIRSSKDAARELARVKDTHAKKAEEVAEARTFGRVSAKILGHIESIVSGLDGLSEAQQDAARGYILRKAQGANARAFFERSLAEVESDIRKQVGAVARRVGSEKRTTAVMSAKKAPSAILPNKTSGGSAVGGNAAAGKSYGGLTQAELQVLRATHRTTYERVVSGNATKQELAQIKSILKE